MVKKMHGVIIETPTEARQAEPRHSILWDARDECCHRGRRNGSCAVLVFPDLALCME